MWWRFVSPRLSYRELRHNVRASPTLNVTAGRIYVDHYTFSGSPFPACVPSLDKIHRFAAELLRYNRKKCLGCSPILNFTGGACWPLRGLLGPITLIHTEFGEDSLIRGWVTAIYDKKFGAPTLNSTTGIFWPLYIVRNPIVRMRKKFGENSSIRCRFIAI